MDLEPYRRAWSDRARQEEERAAVRRRDALALLPALMHVLVDEFGASAVALIGSLSTGPFRADSDIDLVAKGIDARALFKAGAALDRVARDFRVDLIPWESASDGLRDAARREGRVLHGEL